MSRSAVCPRRRTSPSAERAPEASTEHGLRWHVFVWDLWFLLWGLALGLAAWRSHVDRTFDTLVVFVDLGADYGAAKQASEQNSGKPTEPVDGLGEEAFWDPHGFLMAARGVDFFVTVVLVSRGDQAKLIAQGKQILATMLGNL